MKYSISTCSFYKYRIRKLMPLNADVGVEIFFEYGSKEMWRSLMNNLNQGGKHSFSIHAPFAFVDIAEKCDEKRLFDTLRQAFDLYHEFNGEFYVLHTYGDEAARASGKACEYHRKLAEQRLFSFNEICKSEGVVLGAENLCSGTVPLFDQEQFLVLFRNVPDMRCVLDVGHALVSGMDISALQKTLRNRICAYHLHDNDGKADLHLRLNQGICDWNAFAENCHRYTPDAIGVLEYMDITELNAYREDMVFLEERMKSS